VTAAGGASTREEGSGERDGSTRPSSPAEDLSGLADDYDDYDDDEYRPRPFWSRPSTLVVFVVVLLVLSGAVTAWLRISDLQEQVSALEAQTVAADEARQVATLLAEDLATYDYRDLGGNFRHVAAAATPRFTAQLRQLTDELGPELQQTRAVAKATARSAGVITADLRKAVVGVFIDQTVTNTRSTQPHVEQSRMELTLLRQDGVWRLDQAGEL
jgi:Mce-associated membrane protein